MDGWGLLLRRNPPAPAASSRSSRPLAAAVHILFLVSILLRIRGAAHLFLIHNDGPRPGQKTHAAATLDNRLRQRLEHGITAGKQLCFFIAVVIVRGGRPRRR